MSAGHFPFGASAVKPRPARLPGAGVVSSSYGPYPRHLGTCAVGASSVMIPRTAFSETRVRSMALNPAVPVPARGGGERLRHLRPEPGVFVNPEPGVAAVGGCPARCRASMSSGRANTSGADGRPEASSPCSTGVAGRRPGLFLTTSTASRITAFPGSPRPCGAGPRRRRRPDPVASLACRPGRRPCSRAATRPCRPRDTP